MNVRYFLQNLLTKQKKGKNKKFSINFNFISCNERLPSESGVYYVYTAYGEIQSLEYCKKYNLWNANDHYIDAAFDNNMVLYWSENINTDNDNLDENKNNKVIMTPGELSSKLLLAYYSGKLNEDEDILKEISIMNNTDVIKNISDKGQLIDWD